MCGQSKFTSGNVWELRENRAVILKFETSGVGKSRKAKKEFSLIFARFRVKSFFHRDPVARLAAG